MKLSLVEYQSFEAMWRRKPGNASEAEFHKIHGEQHGTWGEKDLSGKVIAKRTGVKDIARIRTQTGQTSRDYTRQEDDVTKDEYETKRRRLSNKVSAGNGFPVSYTHLTLPTILLV
eukprot:2487980-Pyramimonas_sp.AAC.1